MSCGTPAQHQGNTHNQDHEKRCPEMAKRTFKGDNWQNKSSSHQLNLEKMHQLSTSSKKTTTDPNTPSNHKPNTICYVSFFLLFFCTAAVSDKMLTHFLGQLSGLGFLQLGDASLRLGPHDTPTPVTSDLKQTKVLSATTKNGSKHTHHHFQWPKFTVCIITNQYLLLRHSQGIKSQSSIHRVCNMYHHGNLTTLQDFTVHAHSTWSAEQMKTTEDCVVTFQPQQTTPAQPQPCTHTHTPPKLQIHSNNCTPLPHLHIFKIWNSWTVLSYFGSQMASQSLNEVRIYRLQPKSAAKGDFFHIFLSFKTVQEFPTVSMDFTLILHRQLTI